MFLTIGLFILISLGLGLFEIGLIVHPLLNIGLGYLVARQRNCDSVGQMQCRSS